MNPRARLALFTAAALAGAVGVAGLVSAQQGGVPAAPQAQSGALATKAQPAKSAPPKVNEEPPPPVNDVNAAVIPATPSSEAADVQPDAADDAVASSKPAPQKPVEPMKRPRYAVAVIQAMDKVTAETMRFEAPINKPIRYKSLIFIVRACETNAPDEDISDAAAHVEIDSVPMVQQGAAAPARQVFRGWMFANSPGLNLFQSPAYDAWLIACKTASPAA
jgi:hypothetical protein